MANARGLFSPVGNPERAALRLASAVALVAAALGLHEVLGLGLDQVPRFAAFYPAVVVAALVLGFVPGLLATALSAFVVYLWILVPRGEWKVPGRLDLGSIAIYVAAGVLISAIARAVSSARRRADLEKDVAVTAAVRGSQEHLRLAAQAAQTGTWELDLRTGESTWSQELWSLFGLEPQACKPSFEAWRSTILPDDRAGVEQAVADAMRGGTTFDVSWRVRERDGRERWLLSKGRPERGAGGEVVRYLGVVLDATERKRTEAALQKSRTTLEAALAAMTEAVFVTDAAGHFIDFNDAFVTFHRFSSREEATRTLTETRHFVDVLMPDGAPAPLDRRPVSRALSGEAATNVEFILLRKDTKESWVGSFSFAPIRLGGEVVGAVVVGRDVTEQKRAHERLATERERLAVTLRSIGDAVIATDEEARITILNQAAEGLTGWTADEALGRPIQEVLRIISEDTRRPVQDPTERALREGVMVGLANHTALVARDGTERPIVNCGAPIRDTSGRIRGAVLVLRDQSEERRAEHALRESEARFRVIFEQAAVGVQQIDVRTSRFLEVNARFCEMLGYSREEIMAGTWQDFTHPDDLQANLAHSRRVEATGEPDRFEKRYVRKDGAIVWTSLTVSPLVMPGEEPTTRVAIVEDITERKRVDEAMRRSEERFRALTERSSDLIQVLDARGNFQFWSQSTVEDLGFTSEEMLGRSAVALIHEADRPRVLEVLGRLLSSPGAIARDSFRFPRKDGSWRHLEAVARNLLDDPAVEGVVVNSRDVTEQRLLEEQLRQAQKLESVGRLAGGVAHDFNNLLTVILGCSEMLRDKLGPRGGEDLEDVEQIHAAGERARDLTGQLLAFARKQVIAPVPLDLNSVVRSNQKMVGHLLGEGVVLEVKLSPSPWTMHADPTQVEQVLLNLAVNARDAMPRGGKLVIETRNTAVQGHDVPEGLRPGDWVQLVIRDSGVGMTEEVRAHLFEPFFTTKEQGKGTGLGLATVYGIVSQAGGHIHLESELGRGTTFTVCFPRVDRALELPQSVTAPVSTQGTEAILVVEDDPMVRGVVVRALEAEGYQVSAMGHPRLALELGQDDLCRLRLLVTDVVMPEVDGRTLAESLGQRSPGLKVLYLSGYTGDAISERGILDSRLEFLAKPFTRSALLAKVRAVLDAG